MRKPYARGIVRDGNRFLVVHNISRNRYEFPGGKLDEGEDYKDCARRELLEEIGIQAVSMSYFASRDITVESGDWRGEFWIVNSYNGVPAIPESEAHKLNDLRWVTADELAGLPQIPRVTVDLAREVLQRF